MIGMIDPNVGRPRRRTSRPLGGLYPPRGQYDIVENGTLFRKQSSMLGIKSKKSYFTGDAFIEALRLIHGRKCEQ